MLEDIRCERKEVRRKRRYIIYKKEGKRSNPLTLHPSFPLTFFPPERTRVSKSRGYGNVLSFLEILPVLSILIRTKQLNLT